MYDVASFTHVADYAVGSPALIHPALIRYSGRIRSSAPSTLSRAQSSSVYNGITVSLKRQMSHGMYFQVGYTLAKAIDDGPDALVVGRSGQCAGLLCIPRWNEGQVLTISDNRFVAAWVAEPKFQFQPSEAWNKLVNNWKFPVCSQRGSGRPVNATMAGDPNGDGNIYNDRLPGIHQKCIS